MRLDMRLLSRLGIGKPLLQKAHQQACQNGTDIESELLATGQISWPSYYEAIAQTIGVPFLKEIPAEYVNDGDFIDTQLVETTMVRVSHPKDAPIIALCPNLRHLPAIMERCAASPSFRQSIAIAAPDTIRKAVWQTGQKRRLSTATNRLFDSEPRFSARLTLSGVQGFTAGLVLTTLTTFFIEMPHLMLQLAHIALAVLYMLSLLVRFFAIKPRKQSGDFIPSSERLPVYTVLIPLYREEKLLPQLVTSMMQLNWPASRLEIKLVCEADDLATIAAARKHASAPRFEIIEVPACLPRTKPKALTYALATVRGEFVVIYDAEDRPHPEQLQEAYARFSGSPETLACLQAPLIVSNASSRWISTLFALEYSALFRAILPLLADLHLPLPLGGTSNHFRTRALLAAEGWDPFNVTEDADLGIRFSRLGWRCGMLTRPTLEDAPEEYPVWLNQRSRWFKGWMQTLLVHFRNPLQLVREIGLFPTLVLVATTGGMLFSALAHPALLMTLGAASFSSEGLSAWGKTLLLVDFCNLFGSYAIFVAVGRLHMTKRERRALGKRWLAVPVYWIMISLAAWRGVYELWARPHFWRKTPHKPSK